MKGALKTPEFTQTQPVPAGAGAGPRRRHGHRRNHGHLPLFRGDEARAGAVRHGAAGAGHGRDVEPAHGARACCSAWRRPSATCTRRWRSWRCRRWRPGARPTSPGCWKCWRFWTRNWRKRRFIAGDAYSVADITALVAIDFMKPAQHAAAGRLEEPGALARGGVGAAEREGLKRPAVRAVTWGTDRPAECDAIREVSCETDAMKLTVVGCGDAFGSGGRLQTCYHVETAANALPDRLRRHGADRPQPAAASTPTPSRRSSSRICMATTSPAWCGGCSMPSMWPSAPCR